MYRRKKISQHRFVKQNTKKSLSFEALEPRLQLSAVGLESLYAAGYEWERDSDWTSGHMQDSSDGNPVPDSNGNETWKYAYVSNGDGLGGDDPWYENTQSLMIWDEAWGGSFNAWARTDNSMPFATMTTMSTRNVYSPVSAWLNPTGRSVTVDLTGSVSLSYGGGASGDADVAIVQKHFVSNSEIEYLPLIGETINSSGGSPQQVNVSLADVLIGPCDEILVTVQYPGGTGWVTLTDSSLSIELDSYPSSPTEYQDAYTWDRSVEWTPGTTQNSTDGNPDDDLKENDAWRYGYVTGDGVGGENPWYEQSQTLMIWDAAWCGGPGVWAKSDNAWCFATATTMGVHGTYEPVANWLNPTGETIVVDLTGSLKMAYGGTSSGDSDVALVLKHYDSVADSDVYIPLIAETLNSSNGTTQLLPVSFRNIVIGPDDEILVTHRYTSTSGWVTLTDDLEVKIKNPTAYQEGMIQWQRAEDWTDNTNPDYDVRYNQPTWEYEYVTATNSQGVGTATPWYTESSSSLSWDNDFDPATGLDGKAWAYGDNQGPAIFDDKLVDLGYNGSNRRPMLTWTNTTDTTVAVDVIGELLLEHANGATGTSAQFAIASREPDGTCTTLYTYSSSSTYQPYKQVDVQNVVLEPEDQIVVSLFWNYGTDTTAGHYVYLDDSTLLIRVNPIFWDRSSDWTDRPAGDDGTTIGNPDGDTVGFGAWQYSSISGGNSDGFGTGIPWYTKTSEPLVWCDDWRGTTEKGWVYTSGSGTSDVGPAIFSDRLVHSGEYGAYRPSMEWINPTNRTIAVDITGNVQAAWEGSSGTAEGEVEVALARRNADGTTTALWTDTVDSDDGLQQDMLVNLSRVSLRADESLVLSMRWDYDTDTSSTHWVALYDSLKIKLADTIDIVETTNEDTPVTITYLSGGSAITSSNVYLEKAPFYGTPVVQANGTIVYTPDSNFNGTDKFTYGVDYPGVGSTSVEVIVNVAPVNDVPTVSNDTLVVANGRALNVDVLANDTDADYDLLTVSIDSDPSHGRLMILEDQSITYVSTDGYTGSDSFTYKISDGTATSSAATVNVTITDPLYVYLKTDGDDEADGLSWANALATTDALIKMLDADEGGPAGTTAIEVVYEGGTYRELDTRSWGTRHSGTATCPIVNRPKDLYEQDFVWNRDDDWTAGTTAGETTGNPDDDANGRDAWRYGYVTGGDGVGGEDPWYEGSQILLEWDAAWFGGAEGLWAKDDDTLPVAARTNLTVHGADSSVANWMNPTGKKVLVDLTGSVTATYNGGASGDADVAVVLKRYVKELFVDETWHYEYVPLVAQTINSSGGSSQQINVSVEDVVVGPQDEILITPRYVGASGWLTLNDTALEINLLTPTPEEVRITGSMAVDVSWTYDSQNGYYYADVSSVTDLPASFNTLFVDGVRATRAREPDVGYHTIVSVDSGTERSAFEFSEGDIDGTWGNLTDIEVCTLLLWLNPREIISSVDDENNIVTFANSLYPGASYDMDYGGAEADTTRYWVENFLEGLDTEGEWYHDETAEILYYKPLSGQTVSTAEFTVPTIQRLVTLWNAEYITFTDMTFAETDWVQNNGYGGRQPDTNGGTATLSGAFIYNGEGISFTNNVFKNIGGYALKSASVDAQIVGNEFYDIGAGGIIMYSDEHEGQRVSLNNIHDVTQVYHDQVGLFVQLAGDMRVTNNVVYNANYTGLRVGDQGDNELTDAHDILVQHNEVYDVMQELYDGSGIYLAGYLPDTVVQANWVRDVVKIDGVHLPDSNMVQGLYLDEGSTGVLVRGNLVNNTTTGLMVHYPPKDDDEGWGSPAIIDSNIFVDSGERLQRLAQYPKMTFRSNVFAWTEDTDGAIDLFSTHEGDVETFYPYDSDYNLLYIEELTDINAGTTLADHQNLGQDLHSIVADPSFLDPTNGDYRLDDDSPAVTQLGFSAPWLVEGASGPSAPQMMMGESSLFIESVTAEASPIAIGTLPSVQQVKNNNPSVDARDRIFAAFMNRHENRFEHDEILHAIDNRAVLLATYRGYAKSKDTIKVEKAIAYLHRFTSDNELTSLD